MGNKNSDRIKRALFILLVVLFVATMTAISASAVQPAIAKAAVLSSYYTHTVHLSSDQSLNAGSTYWDFGDGSSSTEANPIHTYNDIRAHTVTLTTKDVEGGGSTSDKITV